MVSIKTTNQIINNQIDFFRNVQPDLDTKPGTVARDVLIDGPASQLSRLYEELSAQSNLQSLRLSIGSDLDRLAQNFGAIRERGARSTGPALLTFNNLDADIGVNKGDIITAKNGATFLVLNSFNISTTLETTFRATASRFRADLDLVGITDEFAVEILVEAAAAGRQGNISKYSLNRTTIPGINNVTNASAFGGGRPAENDATFRNRIFSIFSGANTGTELGYRNAALGDPSTIDAEVVVPGDDLMTRDGTEVFVAEDGTRTIISEGTGGKVDIYVFGTRLQEVIDTFIYRDLSNTGDPTNSANNRVLGQITGDENKTVTRRRLENIENGTLPNQPANNIVSVTGSSSGGNFAEETTDELGRVTGNFRLVKDTGVFGGSPFGFDALAWISDRISDLEEDKTKISFNGQDPLGFTDVLEIGASTQNLLVNNENSTVNPADRSSIQLAHFPVQNVTRVFNLTTGERYVIANQNPDGTGTINQTGRIVISGQSLPAISDILQVDYTWVFSYDPTFDYDNRLTNTNPRTVQDSIDWGFSNAVRRERVTLIATGSNLTATVTHPISTVVSVNAFTDETGSLTLSSGRVAFVTSAEVTNVVSITRDSDGAELFNTGRDDGSFSGFLIFLPTDTVGGFGEQVTVTYNTIDVFNADNQGNFNSNTITIVPSTTATAGTIVEANYIANVTNILPSTTLANLPAIRSSNNFDTDNSTSVGNQPTSHIFSNGEIVQNLRQAPSNLALNVSGSISPGTLTVSGTTLEFAQDVVFTVGTEGLKQTLSSAIRTYLGLNSQTPVPSNLSVARISKVERVTTPSTLSQEVTGVLQDYDVRGYSLLNNSFVLEESIQDSSLTALQFVLPATPDNLENPPSVGDRLRVSFHIQRTEDSENIPFSRSGTLYTQKKFALVDTVSISSGFTSNASNSATLSISNLNQPVSRSRYRVFYDYTAPKQNERITVRYNYDRLITDVTFNVENTRPVNADVLVKSAIAIPVDITLNVVVTNAFINNTETVRQNVIDAVTASLNAQELGTTIDSSDLINMAYTVDGVDRVRVIFFNQPGKTGSVLSVDANSNEYIQANTVTVNIETR